MRSWLPGVFLFVLTCGVYAREPFNGFIWDDPQYVVDNPTLKTAGGLWDIWANPLATPQYYPAVHTSFWIEARLWGTTRAAGYHIDNVLLHATAAVLLWRVLVAIGVPWPWLAAAVFAVHPVMVESVAWVTERKNVLSTTFYLLAVLAYVRAGPIPFSRPASGPRSADVKHRDPQAGRLNRGWYAASIGLFLLALFSKTVTCSLPAALLLVVYWKRGRITWPDVRPLLPMLTVGLAMAAVTAHLERAHVGATGRDFDWLTPADRVLIAGWAVWFYAGKIVWPRPLLFMYPRWTIDPHQAWQWAYPALAIVSVAGLWAGRRRLGRGPLVGVLFFVGTLTPALGFANVYPMRYSWVADHFQYLAAVGWIAVLVGMIARLTPVAARPVVATIVLAPLAVLTWRQQAQYRDAQTLWTATIAANPGSWMAHVNLASAYRAAGHEAAADAEIERALRLDGDVADTHYSMGAVYASRGDWPDAIREFRTATELGPQVAACWASLARALWDHGTGPADQALAEQYAHHAIVMDGSLADARRVLAGYAEATGDWPAAVAEYEKLLPIVDADGATSPTVAADLHDHLGMSLLNAGRPAEAAGEFARSTALVPSKPQSWYGYGRAAARAGHPAEAAAALRRALQLDPNYAPARRALEQLGGHG